MVDVLPLGMYTAAATDVYSTVAHLTFLRPIPVFSFWTALLAWILTFIGMAIALWKALSRQTAMRDML